MARLVIRISDNSHPDPKLNAMRTQIGDVVEICEDGHWFSDGEVHCGQYRIVEVPGVPALAFEHLKESEMDADENMLSRRKLALNDAQLAVEIQRVKAAGQWLGKPDIDALAVARK